MNTQKIEKQPTKKIPTQHIEHIDSLNNKNKINLGLKILSWTNYGYSILMFILFTVFVFSKPIYNSFGLYSEGFYDENGHLLVGIIVLICFGILGFISRIVQYFLNKILFANNNFLYVDKDSVLFNLVVFYLLIVGVSSGPTGIWLWTENNNFSFGGIQLITLISIFSAYMIWRQFDHFYGEKTRALINKFFKFFKNRK